MDIDNMKRQLQEAFDKERAEQERADALEYMGEAEWRDLYDDKDEDLTEEK